MNRSRHGLAVTVLSETTEINVTMVSRVTWEAQLDRAAMDHLERKIAEAVHEAQARGLGVVSVGSKMIDPPVVHRALKLMERARLMGLVPDQPRTGAER